MAITMSLLYTSCNKNELDTTTAISKPTDETLFIGGKALPGLSIKDGTMHFLDLKSFDICFPIISSNLKYYEQFSTKYNFESVFSISKTVEKEIDNIISKGGSKDEIISIYEKYPNLYYFNQDYYEVNLDLLNYSPVLNDQKIFYINDVLYYFDSKGQITIWKGINKLDKLNESILLRKSNFEEGVSIFSNSYKPKGGLRAACSTYFNSGWVNFSSNTRRGKLIIESKAVEFFQGGGFYRYDFFQYYRGDSQRKSFGIFVTYSTNHLLSIVNNDLKASTIPLTTGPPYTHLIVNLNVPFNDQTYIYYTSATVHTWVNQPQTSNYAPAAPDYLNVTYTTQGGVNMNHTCQ